MEAVKVAARSFESSGARPVDGGDPDGRGGRAWPAILLVLIAAILVGGGGSHYGLANLAVLLAALLALSFHRHAFARFWREAPGGVSLLVAASILLPAVQLVPLPYATWSSLPSRDLVEQSFDLAGLADATGIPLSVHPARTALALLALIVPLAVLTIGWAVPRDRLITAGWLVVALGIAQFLLGVVQVLSNGETGLLYPENPMPGVLFGFFANRNSTGLFLVGALTLATILPPPSGMTRAGAFLRATCIVILVLEIVLTRSRTALALAFLPLALGTVRAIRERRRMARPYEPGSGRSRNFSIAVIALFVAALGATFATSSGRFADTIERFDAQRVDARLYIWDDATYTIERFWPVGAGMGTFDDVFQIDESLESLSERRAGRAHNDYIEVAIEAGAAGLILVAAWLFVVAWLAWRARLARRRWIAWSGATILLTVALQSITDYPLRNLSMLALAAFALLLLVRFGENGRDRGTLP